MSMSTWYGDKKKKGKVLKEMDAYLELQRNHGQLLKDTLTGDFGRSHGDYNLAHHQAEGVLFFVDAMTRGDTQLPELLKAAEAAKKAAASEQEASAPAPQPVINTQPV